MNTFARRLTAGSRARLGWRLLLLLLVAAVSYLALTPRPPIDLTTGWDKFDHVTAFSALALAGCLGFPESRRQWLLVMCALLGFGALIEVLQYFVPGRSCEWGDLIADSVGMGVGSLMASCGLAVARVDSPSAR